MIPRGQDSSILPAHGAVHIIKHIINEQVKQASGESFGEMILREFCPSNSSVDM